MRVDANSVTSAVIFKLPLQASVPNQTSPCIFTGVAVNGKPRAGAMAGNDAAAFNDLQTLCERFALHMEFANVTPVEMGQEKLSP